MRTFITFFLIIIFFGGCQDPNQPKVVIAASANMQYAIKEIASAFTRNTGIPCEIITGSSGKLMAQIEEGAPYEVFISADITYPQTLYSHNLTTDTPEIYAYGTLVLWSVRPDILPSMDLLLTDEVTHIAIANPETAPYGKAAVQVLKHFNLYDQIRHKLVFGESISQTNQFINTGAAEIGFTAKSVVLASHIKDQGKWIPIDQKTHLPIAQSAVLIKHPTISEKTEKFYHFLFSQESRRILENFGYLVTENR